MIDHLIVGEICKGASKNVVLKVVVLEAGNMGMHEDLNKFNKNNGDPATKSWVAKAH